MKKFLKFLFCAFSLAAAALGVYYLIKNVINKDDPEDDLDDDFDEFETNKEDATSDSREYVPINMGDKDEEAKEADAPYEADEKTETEE